METLNRCHLLEPAQLRELSTDLQHRFPEPRDLARELIHRDWLTPYQVNQIFLGRGDNLLLGQYVLLQRLGEGGMGQVFKARHRSLGRVVALKVLHKEMMQDPHAVRRFRREMEACAQLSHPNIVRALDADEAGGTYFLVMEYIDGIDLARLVQERGPLPVAQTCDFIRQAALGLEHARECGLVHRDIKPHNLLVTPIPGKPAGSSALLQRPRGVAGRWGTVKILDMGLALLRNPGNDPDSTLLTQLGTIMGTPDYIAPEQVHNSHDTDIRTDLYSLGCTFYFLLAGQIPFPLGSLAEKLLQHQFDEPIPVEDVRREHLAGGTFSTANLTGDLRLMEVPAKVAGLVRKLMAKRPEDRIQTPGELAATLMNMLNKAESTSLSRQRLQEKSGASRKPAAPERRDVTVVWQTPAAAGGPQPATLEYVAEAAAEAPLILRPRRPAQKRHLWRTVLLLGLGGLMLAGLLAGWLAAF